MMVEREYLGQKKKKMKNYTRKLTTQHKTKREMFGRKKQNSREKEENK